MTHTLPSGLTVPFAWLAIRPSDDPNFLLSYVTEVVTQADKDVLLDLLKAYAFSCNREASKLDQCVIAIKWLKKKAVEEAESSGL